MLLDSPAFKPVVTPEVALSIIQKAVAERGWQTYELGDLKLVYTPYWLFSFDVTGGEAAPTGKTALNAASGELNEFVPMLTDRPLKKIKQTEDGVEAEIEPTAVTMSEAKTAAAVKVAANAGLKPEQVSVSAFTKVYVPTYRVWVTVAGNEVKIEVDAALGAPFGLEQIPAREKGWSEATKETLTKMKSPSGWIDLFGKTAGMVLGGAVKGDKNSRYLLLGLAVVILLGLFFWKQGVGGSSVEVDCKPYDAYLGAKPLFGVQKINPAINEDNSLEVRGQCSFLNKGGEAAASTYVQITIASGNTVYVTNTSNALNLPGGTSTPTLKEFLLRWNGDPYGDYSFAFKKI